MGKLLIDNVIIEKSNKDIKTGINYNFTEGLNLICGNNEAGKSSLMKFIREGFFRVKGIDTGKIYFSILNDGNYSKYRTDIKDSRTTDQRCKLFDENNSVIDYSFIEKTINQKYFEQGFTIDLDDLMSIQNKDTATLVDIIKDPSGEKLSDFIEKTKLEAKKIVGDNGRLTKETSLIIEKISLLNSKINELSNKEVTYNSSIQTIKTTNEELESICNKEELFNLILESNEVRKQINILKEEYNNLHLNFNEKLFNDKETYLSVIQNVGKYDSNLNILLKNKAKLDALISKININMHCLNIDYSLNIQEKDILDFVLDYSKIKQIKELISQKGILEKEVIALQISKENIEEILLKLKHENSHLKEKTVAKDEIEKLDELYKFVDESLKQYNFLLSKINEIEKNTKINSSGINANKNLLILFATLFIMTVASSLIGFYQKIPIAGVFSILMAILSAVGFLSLKLTGYKDKCDSEINKDKEIKDSILNSLKDKLKDYYSEINNIESSYLPFKIDNIKQEIFIKIQNYKNAEEILSKNNTDSEYNTEKLANIQDKLNQIKQKADLIKEQINELIQIETNDCKLDENVYLNVVDIIKELKEDIKEKNIIKQEIEELSKENETILKIFNSFILSNEINISVSEKYEDNIGKIKAINEKNLGIKTQLDVLNSEIQNIQNKLDSIENEKNSFVGIEYSSTAIELQLEELLQYKKEVLNRKKEAEFQKRELESFEGLNDLKIQKNILIDEYRKKIAELIKNKLIISVIETAKSNFDKTQPDLKNAQKYLSILTDGKYSKINLDMKEIQNESCSVTKKWEELSRGTKEQLYLALRLGYASNYSKDKVTLESNGRVDLPVIIDDAFVNFDFLRTKNALKCLAEFSKTNQVLFFSCHTDLMKKHFESLETNFNIINL